MPQSRRQFLQLSAALAAGACGPLSFGDHARADGNSGLVGILGVRDCDVEHAIAESGGRAALLGDDPDEWTGVDAVIIGSSVEAPEEAARFALERGLHVLSIDSLGRSIQELRSLSATAVQQGVVLRSGLVSHELPAVKQVASIIDSGALGTLREIVCWTTRSESRFAEREFRTRGCRVLSLPFLALDGQQPVSIYGAGSTVLAEGLPESLAVRCELPATPKRSAIFVTWYDGAWAPPYESIDGYELSSSGTLYLGETGQLLEDATTGVRVVLRDGEQPWKLPRIERVARRQGIHQWLADFAAPDARAMGFSRADQIHAAVLGGLASYRVQQSLEWDSSALCARNCPHADVIGAPLSS